MATTSTFTHLESTGNQEKVPHDKLIKLCPKTGLPLVARYDLAKAKTILTKEFLANCKDYSIWRYEAVLPVLQKKHIVTLGEGWTRLHACKRLGDSIGCPNTYIKDEGTNPTGSFKARGLCLAVSKAYELGAKSFVIPSAGNAAGALSAYGAVCGIPVNVFMPKDVPEPFIVECATLGAKVTLIEGLITDCGKAAKAGIAEHGWFDVSTLKEPYRIEGKKTMGYEIAEQFNWELPDVIIYPTGGGTGLIGMWKAFKELKEMGMLASDKMPRMVSVQADGCAPIIKAFNEGKKNAEMWQNAHTMASGLRVPAAIGDFMILNALRESKGTAVAVSDAEMLKYTNEIGKYTGIFACPEGGAVLAAQVQLIKKGWIKPEEKVVLFNTGTGIKYFDCLKPLVQGLE